MTILTLFFNILQVAKNMGSVVKSLEKAVNSMELQKITEVMDKFESQFEDLDVHTSVSRICTYSSMTSLFAHKVAQPTKWRFLPKNLSHLAIFVIGIVST